MKINFYKINNFLIHNPLITIPLYSYFVGSISVYVGCMLYLNNIHVPGTFI